MAGDGFHHQQPGLESTLRVRPISPPLGHRGILQTGQAEPQARQFPGPQRQCGEMAGLHGSDGLCAAAIHGASFGMGA